MGLFENRQFRGKKKENTKRRCSHGWWQSMLSDVHTLTKWRQEEAGIVPRTACKTVVTGLGHVDFMRACLLEGG